MKGSNTRRRRAGVLVVAAAAVGLAIGVTTALADDEGQPIDFTHNVYDAPAPVTNAVFGTTPSAKNGQAICTTTMSLAANVNTDCEGANGQGIGPHNESSIAVNPTNPANMIGGLNDYQLSLNAGGHDQVRVDLPQPHAEQINESDTSARDECLHVEVDES